MGSSRHYKITFVPRSRRELETLPRRGQKMVAVVLERLATDPRPRGAKLLVGTAEERVWRIAAGDYRMLYQVEDDRLVVLVIRVADGREAYGPALRRLLRQIRRTR